MCGLLNHKNRTILLLFYSCDDSSKCNLNNSRHTLVDERVFWICCICWINKDDHFFGYIQRQFAFERHACICGTEEFGCMRVNQHFNAVDAQLLLECSDTDGRQVISHVLNKLSWLKNVKNTIVTLNGKRWLCVTNSCNLWFLCNENFGSGVSPSPKQRGGGGLGYPIKLMYL